MSNTIQIFVNSITEMTKTGKLKWLVPNEGLIAECAPFFRGRQRVFRMYFADCDINGADRIIICEKHEPVHDDEGKWQYNDREYEIVVLTSNRPIANVDRTYVSHTSLRNLYTLIEQENIDAKKFFGGFESPIK